MQKETVIHASFYCKYLDEIEGILKDIFNKSEIKKIEQGEVLLYEDAVTEFSVEFYNDSFYLIGRHKESLKNAELLINEIAEMFKKNKISFSIDYQEEYNDVPSSKEFNISFNLI